MRPFVLKVRGFHDPGDWLGRDVGREGSEDGSEMGGADMMVAVTILPTLLSTHSVKVLIFLTSSSVCPMFVTI